MSDLILFAQALDTGMAVQYGLPGIIIFWFARRAETRLDAMAEAIRELSKSILLDVVTRDTTSHAVKDEVIKSLEKMKGVGQKP